MLTSRMTSEYNAAWRLAAAELGVGGGTVDLDQQNVGVGQQQSRCSRDLCSVARLVGQKPEFLGKRRFNLPLVNAGCRFAALGQHLPAGDSITNAAPTS